MFNKHILQTTALTLLIALTSGCSSKEPNTQTVEIEPPAEQEQIVSDSYMTQRVMDLTLIAEALEAYKTDNQSYPSTAGDFQGIQFGYEPGGEWIPGLVPQYLKELPQDPKRGPKDTDPQYLYASDGVDFKLIAHRVADVENLPSDSLVKVDPRRKSWGYGIWTNNYAQK